MAADEIPPLPFEQLKKADEALPWAALEEIAEAVAIDESKFEWLKRFYYESDPYGLASFEAMFTPAILAMAAPRMSEAVRGRAVEFVVRELAGNHEPSSEEALQGTFDVGLDELTEEMFLRAAGLLGPGVLPAAVAAMEGDPRVAEGAFGLWWVLTLAAESKDECLRGRIVALAEGVLQKELAKDKADEIVRPVAFVLAAMGHKPSRGLIEALRPKADTGQLEEPLFILDGLLPAEPLGPWAEPLKEAVTRNWESMRDWYAEIEAMPDPGDVGASADEVSDEDELDDEEDIDYDAAEKRADELASRFVASAAFTELPEEMRPEAGFTAFNLLAYAAMHEGKRPEELDERTLREVLTEIFPRKVTGDSAFFRNVAPIVAALVRWLGSEGILDNADRLAGCVAKWTDEIVANAADKSRWGVAKGLAMFAEAQGLDPTDPKDMLKAQQEFNRRLARGTPEAGPDEDLLTLPPGETIVRDSPKVGRNDPCPCGSGKKYKKCCGKP